jgi:hypothetical protein
VVLFLRRNKNIPLIGLSISFFLLFTLISFAYPLPAKMASGKMSAKRKETNNQAVGASAGDVRSSTTLLDNALRLRFVYVLFNPSPGKLYFPQH